MDRKVARHSEHWGLERYASGNGWMGKSATRTQAFSFYCWNPVKLSDNGVDAEIRDEPRAEDGGDSQPTLTEAALYGTRLWRYKRDPNLDLNHVSLAAYAGHMPDGYDRDPSILMVDIARSTPERLIFYPNDEGQRRERIIAQGPSERFRSQRGARGERYSNTLVAEAWDAAYAKGLQVSEPVGECRHWLADADNDCLLGLPGGLARMLGYPTDWTANDMWFNASHVEAHSDPGQQPDAVN